MREVYVLHNFFNQVRLPKLYTPFREGINVYTDVVVEGPLILNVKLVSDLCDILVDCCVTWGGKDSLVQVDKQDDFASI